MKIMLVPKPKFPWFPKKSWRVVLPNGDVVERDHQNSAVSFAINYAAWSASKRVLVSTKTREVIVA